MPSIKPKRITPADTFVAARIARRCHEINLTQCELADRLGITYQQVSKYTRGVDRITVGRLHQLAQALRVPIGYFFEGL